MADGDYDLTWLNAVNDQGMGQGAKVVSGTVRDSLHADRPDVFN